MTVDMQGRPEEAIDDCTQSIELSPTYVKVSARRRLVWNEEVAIEIRGG